MIARTRNIVLALALLAPSIVSAGSATYSTPGTYIFAVPAYGSLTVTVLGAAGGGGAGGNGWMDGSPGNPGGSGTAGGSSSFGTVVASGGSGGSGGGGGDGGGNPGAWGQRGSDGGGSGGDSAVTGGGGASGAGGSGGSGGCYTSDGGNLVGTCNSGGRGGDGGNGGRAVKAYSAGALSPGSPMTVVVGAGGSGGAPGYAPSSVYLGVAGSPGSSGSVSITWTEPPAPTCTVNVSPAIITYGGSSTLSWSSTNADQFYIANVGYVNPTGSTTVSPSQTTTYNGTVSGPGGTANCTGNQTLTVYPPGAPTVSIWADATSIVVGQSSDIHATFAAGQGDILTADNIDQPLGTGLGVSTAPDARKDIVFAPSTPGTYTFYARATTQYFPSWTTYSTVSVTVSAASCSNGLDITRYPACTCPAGQYQSGSSCIDECQPAYSCSGSSIIYSDNQCQSSIVAACVGPQYCAPGAASCLSPAISFVPFDDTLTGHLRARPQMVRMGNTSKVYWNVTNASSCTVNGDNGDAWQGLSSGNNGQVTSPITKRTIYTLECTGFDASHVSEAATVILVPTWNEN